MGYNGSMLKLIACNLMKFELNRSFFFLAGFAWNTADIAGIEQNTWYKNAELFEVPNPPPFNPAWCWVIGTTLYFGSIPFLVLQHQLFSPGTLPVYSHMSA